MLKRLGLLITLEAPEVLSVSSCERGVVRVFLFCFYVPTLDLCDLDEHLLLVAGGCQVAHSLYMARITRCNCTILA